MVTFPRPVVPFCPVSVKEITVLPADWLVVMVALESCELVMFPFSVRVTFAPLFPVA